MKVFFPPLVAFVVFGIIVLLQSMFFPISVGDMSKGNLHAFMACFYYFWPLYFIIALLTQGLIVVPVWKFVESRSAITKDAAVIIVCFIYAAIAVGVAYLIWDKPTGHLHFAWLAVMMLMIQLIYWIVNFFVMLLLEDKVKVKLRKEKTSE